MNGHRRRGNACARAALNNALAVKRDGEMAAAGSRIHKRQGNAAVPFTERDREPTDAAGGDGDLVTCGAASGTGRPLPSCIPNQNQNTVAVVHACGGFVSSTGRAGGTERPEAVDVSAASREAGSDLDADSRQRVASAARLTPDEVEAIAQRLAALLLRGA